VLDTDIGGPDTGMLATGRSRAEIADERNPHPAGFLLHELAWRAVFLHSLVGRAEGLGSKIFGITERDALFETAFPGLTPPQVEAALREIENSAFYLRFDRDHGRYFGSLEPSINRALAEIREGLREEPVNQLLAVTARKVIAPENGLFRVVPDVAAPEHVPDNAGRPVLGIVSLDADRLDPTADDHIGQLFCRQVICPHCLGEAPLVNSCWLARDDEEPWAARVITDGRERGGKIRFDTYRVVAGRGPNGEDPDLATVADGVGTCIHCHQAIPEDEIKAQAQGRSEHGYWTNRLYCVAAVRFEPRLDEKGHPERYTSGERKGEIKTRKVRFFRPPNERDLATLIDAQEELAQKWSTWEAVGLIPTETIPEDSNYNRGHRLYGMTRWCDLFTPRQLVGHLTLVEELRRLTPEIINALGKERGRAIATYLQFAIDKGVDYNSILTRWHYRDGVALLAWMVARHRLDVRVALRVHARTGRPLTADSVADGYVHMKFAVLRDARGDTERIDGS